MADGVVRRDERLLVSGRGVIGWHPLQEAEVVRAVPRLAEVELVVQFLVLDVGQEEHPPAMERRPVGAVHDGRRQSAVD
jgi:hypothetical protein